MKTERMTLLVTPEEKALLAERAAALGLSTSELVRRAAQEFDPEQQAHLEELKALLPELRAAAVEMRKSLAVALASAEETRGYMATREARKAELARELEADPTINWAGIQRVFGLDAGSSRHEAA